MLMETDCMHAHVQNGTMVECLQNDLTPGRLGQWFHGGAKAILLNDSRARDIWRRLFHTPEHATSGTTTSLLPWDSNLLEMAQNHLTGNLETGDMLRFIPGGIGHIARKMTLISAPDGSIETMPAHFSDFSISQDTLRLTWDLMTDVLRSTFPAQSSLPPYAVTLEMLKYPLSFDDVEQVAALLSDASGIWTRHGMRMDTWKVQATGFFAVRYLRELFAFASLVPGLHGLLQLLNTRMTPFSSQHVPPGSRIIGDPHYDGTKILTALLSERETLTTEIYTGEHWAELPLDSDRLAIFPAQQIDPNFGILPTLHRVLVKQHSPSEPTVGRNITLSLTVIPRPSSKME